MIFHYCQNFHLEKNERYSWSNKFGILVSSSSIWHKHTYTSSELLEERIVIRGPAKKDASAISKLSIVWFQKNIHILAKEGHWKFREGEGVSKATMFKGKYEAKLEFPEGWGCKPPKTIHGRGIDVSWNNTFLPADEEKSSTIFLKYGFQSTSV